MKNKLGNSELYVSKICLGTMVFGEQVDYQESEKIMDYALNNGINFFDVAEIYPVPPSATTYGRSEEFVGRFMQKHKCRDKIVIATKVTGPSTIGPGATLEWIRGGPRLSRSQIIRAVDASLKRLKTDYIDLYQLHWPERKVNIFGALNYVHGDDDGHPISESLAVLEELVAMGKIRYYGVSNETAWGMLECLRVAAKEGYKGIQTIQNQYNLLSRIYEINCSEIGLRENISLLAYSPLCFGVLSGKYLSGEINKKWRMYHPSFATKPKSYSRYKNPQVNQIVQEYLTVANEAGITLAQMSLAFVNSRNFLGSNIIGATTLEQVKENISSLDCKLDEHTIESIDAIHLKYRNPCP